MLAHIYLPLIRRWIRIKCGRCHACNNTISSNINKYSEKYTSYIIIPGAKIIYLRWFCGSKTNPLNRACHFLSVVSNGVDTCFNAASVLSDVLKTANDPIERLRDVVSP